MKAKYRLAFSLNLLTVIASLFLVAHHKRLAILLFGLGTLGLLVSFVRLQRAGIYEQFKKDRGEL